TDQPLTLTQKARITQYSGEDWNNVELVLSTGVPTAGGQISPLHPWYIGYRNPLPDPTVRRKSAGISNSTTIPQQQWAAEPEMQAANIGFVPFPVSENLTQQE